MLMCCHEAETRRVERAGGPSKALEEREFKNNACWSRMRGSRIHVAVSQKGCSERTFDGPLRYSSNHPSSVLHSAQSDSKWSDPGVGHVILSPPPGGFYYSVPARARRTGKAFREIASRPK